MPPTPHPRWGGTRQAVTPGVHCVQGALAPPPGPPPPSPCGGYCTTHGFAADGCGCGVCGSFGSCSFSCTDPQDHNASGRFHRCPHVHRAASVAALAAAISEDCLFLNAFTPSTALTGTNSAGTPAALRPVMVCVSDDPPPFSPPAFNEEDINNARAHMR